MGYDWDGYHPEKLLLLFSKDVLLMLNVLGAVH